VPPPEDVPPCDVLVLAGDLCPGYRHTRDDAARQLDWLHDTLRPWIHSVAADHVVVIAGNHDFVFEVYPRDAEFEVEGIGHSVHYLRDDSIVLDGVVFHGVPWVPSRTIGRWAFCANDDSSMGEAAWGAVSADTDVIVSHGPPYGVLDHVAPRYGDTDVGSPLALEALLRVRPKAFICGHIHEQGGKRVAVSLAETSQPWWDAPKCEVLNVARVNIDYEPVVGVQVIDL
jgi:Icc-related predicted phosphoesterase